MKSKPHTLALKAGLKALWPALLLAQPVFASVRSSSASRSMQKRAVIAAPQTSGQSSSPEQQNSPDHQSNLFAAFGQPQQAEQLQAAEPATELLAQLKAQGLFKVGQLKQASGSGDRLSFRKEFSSDFPPNTSYVSCPNASDAASYLTLHPSGSPCGLTIVIKLSRGIPLLGARSYTIIA